MKVWKILIQILIDIFVMIGLLYLMAHLITACELTIVISGLFGILTGLVIIAIWQVIYIMFDEG